MLAPDALLSLRRVWNTKAPRPHVTPIIALKAGDRGRVDCLNPPAFFLSKDPGLMAADFWAGYLSGALGIVIGNPLDVIKVRLQAGCSTDPLSRSHPSRLDRASSLVRGMPRGDTAMKLPGTLD